MNEEWKEISNRPKKVRRDRANKEGGWGLVTHWVREVKRKREQVMKR